MQSLLTQLEVVLDTLDSKASSLCLTLDAAIQQRLHIPRIYVATDTPLCEVLETCLYSNVTKTLTDSMSDLASMKISKASLEKLSGPERNVARQLIRDVLEKNLGSGTIHYEMERFTPFETCGALPVFHFPLTNVLQKRESEQRKYCKSYQSLMTNKDHDMFSRALRAKLEDQWKSSWLSHKIYLMTPLSPLDGAIF